MGLYTEITNTNSTTLFKYGTILIITLSILRRIPIKLNIFLAILVASIIILYLHEKRNTNIEDLEKQHNLKINTILPPIKCVGKYKDIVDFLYSIQDFHAYNPQAYEEIVDNLISFFDMYESIHKGAIHCEDYYEISLSKKQNAINALHSLIFKLPTAGVIHKKLVKAQEILDELLGNYLNDIYTKCIHVRLRDGFTSESKIINKGPSPYNEFLRTEDRDQHTLLYNNADFTYDIQ